MRLVRHGWRAEFGGPSQGSCGCLQNPQRAEHRRCFRDGLSFIIKSLKCGHVWEAISRKAARPKEKGKSGKTIKDEEQAGDKIM